jgi:hypothetical protein
MEFPTIFFYDDHFLFHETFTVTDSPGHFGFPLIFHTLTLTLTLTLTRRL